jgi:2-amino-4-hydroxy-6-hydroxymethyldihydropteridine diphosphokinase
MLERGFVLMPLAEIAPNQMIAGRPVQEWVKTVDTAGITRLPPR